MPRRGTPEDCIWMPDLAGASTKRFSHHTTRSDTHTGVAGATCQREMCGEVFALPSCQSPFAKISCLDLSGNPTAFLSCTGDMMLLAVRHTGWLVSDTPNVFRTGHVSSDSTAACLGIKGELPVETLALALPVLPCGCYITSG